MTDRNVVAVTDEPPEMQLLRGPLSRRATSAEFNEWQAREIVSYVDRLAAGYPSMVAEVERLQEVIAKAHDFFANASFSDEELPLALAIDNMLAAALTEAKTP